MNRHVKATVTLGRYERLARAYEEAETDERRDPAYEQEDYL